MRWAVLIMAIVVSLLLAACSGSDTTLEAPTANAGEDFSVAIGEQPRFDACASSGDIANYKWTVVAAPETMGEDVGKVIRETEPECAFTLEAQMGVDEVGKWQIQLEVSDAAGNVDTDTVTVTVTE